MKTPHKRLIAWQKSMDLVELTYKLTARFPTSEEYGLVSQMRRAAVAAPSIIAEGAANNSVPQVKRYLSIAIGTLSDWDTQLELAYRVKYIDLKALVECQALVNSCLAVSYGLRRSLGK